MDGSNLNQAGLIMKDFLDGERLCILKGLQEVWVWGWEKAGSLTGAIICIGKEKDKLTSVSYSYWLCDLECVPTFPGCHEDYIRQQASVPSSVLGA